MSNLTLQTKAFHERPSNADAFQTILPRVMLPWFRKDNIEEEWMRPPTNDSSLNESFWTQKITFLSKNIFSRCFLNHILYSLNGIPTTLAHETIMVLISQTRLNTDASRQDYQRYVTGAFVRWAFIVSKMGFRDSTGLRSMLLNKQWWNVYQKSSPLYWCEKNGPDVQTFAQSDLVKTNSVFLRSLLKAYDDFIAHFGHDVFYIPDTFDCCCDDHALFY